MVGDRISSQNRTNRSRPPDWIANTINANIGSARESSSGSPKSAVFRKARHSYPVENKVNEFVMTSNLTSDIAYNQLDVEKGNALEIVDICFERDRRQQTQLSKNKKGRRAAQVVAPNTPKLKFWHRILALAVSLSVAMSLLGIITTLLSAKLDNIETQLGSRKTGRLYPDASSISNHPRVVTSHRRRLLQSGDSTQNFSDGTTNMLSNILHQPYQFLTSNSAVATFLSLFRIARLFMDANNADPYRRLSVVAMPTKIMMLSARNHNSDGHQNLLHREPVHLPFRSFAPANMPAKGTSPGLHSAPQFLLPARADPANEQTQNPTADSLGNIPITTTVLELPATATDASIPTQKRHNNHRTEMTPFQRQQIDYTRTSFMAKQTSQHADRTESLHDKPHMHVAVRTNATREEVESPMQAQNRPQHVLQTSFPHSNVHHENITSPLHTKRPSSDLINVQLSDRSAQARIIPPGYAPFAPSTDEHFDPYRSRSIAQNLKYRFRNAIEMWGVSPDNKHVCRLHRICRLDNGQILLPKWMSESAEKVTLCGLKNATYVINDEPDHPFHVEIDKAKYPAGFVFNFSYVNTDLLGDTVPRDHMPHFVSDILRPLAMLQVLAGAMRDIYPFSAIEPQPSRTNHAYPGTQSDLFHPVLMLFESTFKRPKTDWVPSVAKLFSNVGFVFAPAKEEKKVDNTRTPTPVRGTCFRSVITSNINQHEPAGMFDARGQNILYYANNISREHITSSVRVVHGICDVSITALTRPGPRALLNVHELRHTIEIMAMQMGIRPTFRVVDFDKNSPFEEQVHVMQTTNVLVSSHGAGNSNFIFMRPGAAVIEIFPFSYRAGPFNLFAHIFGLDYRHAMAAPQTDVFKECMKRHETNPDTKAYVFALWDEAVLLDKQNPGIHRLKFEAEFGRPGKSDGMTTRSCARMQELSFDVKQVASMAIDAARTQCQQARPV